MQLQFAQKAFIVHDDRLLLVQKSSSDPHNPGLWEVPGGRARQGEDVDTHICREVWEEVGISITPGRPFYLWQWVITDSSSGEPVQFIAVARSCQPTSFDISTHHRVPGDHLAGARWVPINEVGDYRIIPDMVPVFHDFLTVVIRDYDASNCSFPQ